MTVRARRIVVAALAFVTLLAATAPMLTSAAHADTTDPSAQATLNQIATCLNSNGRLLLVLLVDESGSLQQTDPGNERVNAAKLALGSFASLAAARASSAGVRPSIDVYVTGFSAALSPVLGWSHLDATTLPRIDAAVDGFATQNTGIDTDFPTAFVGVQRELANRSAQISAGTGHSPCKLVLLFTDGQYDIEFGDTPARRAAGTTKSYAPGLSLLDPANKAAVQSDGIQFLCKADGSGLADQLRTDGVTIVTIALAAQIAPADQQFLRALSSGDGGGGVTCGRVRGPGDGTYVAAATIADLVPAFNSVATAIGGGTAAPEKTVADTCGGPNCVRAQRDLTVDDGVGRFTMLADASSTGIRVELDGPLGDHLVIDPGRDGRRQFDATDLHWSWVSPTAVSIDATVAQRGHDWRGHWRLRFVDGTGRHSSAHPHADAFLYGEWAPALASEPRFLLGAPATVLVDVVDAHGARVDPRNVSAKVAVSASVADPQEHRTDTLALAPLTPGRVRGVFTAPRTTHSASFALQLRLDVTTVHGVHLAPRVVVVTMPVAVPELYPQLVTTELQLSSVRGTSAAHGQIRVTGGRDGAGCVWFGAPHIDTSPAGAGSFSLAAGAKSRSDCVWVDPGQTRTVDVSIRPSHSASGSVRGTIEVLRATEGGQSTISTAIPFAFDLAPPINQAQRAWVFVAIFLPGVLLPVLGLWLANRANARFEPARDVVVARVPVAIERHLSHVMRVHVAHEDAGQPVRRVGPDGSPGPLELVPNDFSGLGRDDRRATALSCGDLTFRAHPPKNPFGTPYGDVSAPAPCWSGGVGVEPRSRRLPLSLAGTWVFTLHDGNGNGDAGDDRWIHGELAVLLANGPIESELPPVMATVVTDLRTAANELAAEARAIVGRKSR